MTDELKKKLENEAGLYCQEYATIDNYDSVHRAYIFSAEPREKRIAELEQKIITYKKQINNKEKALARYKAENETLVDFSDMHKCFFESYGFYKRGLNNLLMVKERLEELEKENAELKEKLKEELKTIADKDLSFVARFDALEKENAELKEKLNKIERKCKFNFVDLLHDVENESKQEEQLTNAKEIISKLLSRLNRLTYSGLDCEECMEAEQFLKETK